MFVRKHVRLNRLRGCADRVQYPVGHQSLRPNKKAAKVCLLYADVCLLGADGCLPVADEVADASGFRPESINMMRGPKAQDQLKTC